MGAVPHSTATDGNLEVVAFSCGGQTFCLRTLSIREIRGWSQPTAIPNAPREVVGALNLRGHVIPVIDLACKLGLDATAISDRSAIVVTEIDDQVYGLVVERVSDILSVDRSAIQPVPDMMGEIGRAFVSGIIVTGKDMICLLNLDHILGRSEASAAAA
ncbi:MAG: chemotaxis protein CheW [Notoacmeibacter sp.]|nr:chemotaxis protein CheW [Notoacmeibacter sp.]